MTDDEKKRLSEAYQLLRGIAARTEIQEPDDAPPDSPYALRGLTGVLGEIATRTAAKRKEEERNDE